MCWKKPKDGKSHFGVPIFLEVLLNDEEATMQQLNKLCGDKNVFFYTRIPRGRMPVEVAPRELCRLLKTQEIGQE
jgi:hypothetical protein